MRDHGGAYSRPPRNTLCSHCMTSNLGGLPMTDSEPRSEREQTDESLRLERQHSDNALEQIAAIDATADDVINLARARADILVASARARTDQASSAQPSDALKNSRA